MLCPCGSDQPYEACCGPFHADARRAPTAQALMRSRYAAYVRGDIDYVARTTAPESQKDFDRDAAANWAREADWLGLKIVATENGEAWDEEGMVEFVATYRLHGQRVEHRERSEFRKAGDDAWLFVRGATPERAAAPAVKAGRNDPCPCGSGKKFKKCCGA
jgi:SEC-C motif-containing protein